MKVDLTREEIELAADALDSHKYWQLSDESLRDSGYVYEPLTAEERACDALEDKLRALLRDEPASEMLATPNNMAKLTTVRTPGAQLFAYSPRTFEEYSATAGDYWDRPGDEPLKDSNDEPMVLAYRYEAVVIVEALS